MQSLFTTNVQHENGSASFTVAVSPNTPAGEVLAALSLPHIRGAVQLCGGAGELAPALRAPLAPLFQALIDFAVQHHLAIIDGGTNSGVMALIGQAAANAAEPVLIGVVPAKAEAAPGGLLAQDFLEPHHPYIVLVDADQWGAEITLMNAVMERLAQDIAAATVLINGGEITRKEIEAAVASGRPVLAVKGSGRLADQICAALENTGDDLQIDDLVHRGRFVVHELSAPPAQFTATLSTLIRRGPTHG